VSVEFFLAEVNLGPDHMCHFIGLLTYVKQVIRRPTRAALDGCIAGNSVKHF